MNTATLKQDDQNEKIRVSEEEYCKLNVVYRADPETVKAKNEEAIANLRNTKIPGFRKGKAPDYAIKAKLKNEITAWVMQQLTAQAYDDILFETKAKPIGRPQVTKMDMPDDDNFICEMVVLKKPDFELSQYKGIEIPKPKLPDTDIDKQVENTINDLRSRFGDIAPYGDEDVIEAGDTITFDIETLVDGEKVDSYSEEGSLYTLNGKTIKLPGLDDQLLGMHAGDSKEFDLKIEEALPGVGGKTVHVKVTVHMGTKPVLATLDDEFAKKVGAESLSDLKRSLEELIKNRVENMEKNSIRKDLIEKLVDNTEINVPEWLIDAEGQHLAAQSKLDWEKMSEEDKSLLKTNAKDNVKLSLILDTVRDAEPETVLSDAEVINTLKSRVSESGQDPEAFIVEASKNGRLFGIAAALRDEFTLQWLVDQAKVVE